jgi:Lantibiotic dehydratase, N terminus
MSTTVVNPSPAPEHLIALPVERWALWKCVGLRGAGFPVAGVLKLADSKCARNADELIEAEAEAEQAWEAALEAVGRAIDGAGPGERERLVRAMRQLKKGQPPPRLEEGEAKQQVERFAAACEKADAIGQEFHRAFESATKKTSEAIKEIVRLGTFREALTWQNRDALHTGMDALLEQAASPRSGRQRKREELVASYWQRYCAKNDTIGFFGPVGWARFNAEAEAIRLRAGDNWLARRNTYFESWCIDVLTEKLAADPSIRPWIAPRRAPFVHVEGTTLRLADGSATPLSADEAALLRLCDGARTASEIAKQLLESDGSRLASAAEIYLLLDSLSKREIVSWTLQVPLAKHPERALRKLIERIDDDDLRAPRLEILTRLESACGQVAASAGDAQQLDRALAELEGLFTRVTGAAATKDPGKTYAGRKLVFEDCTRGVDVEIGARLLESLSQPLLLLLTSARWLVAEMVRDYRACLEQIYRELARQTGNPQVPAPALWARAQALLFGGGSHIISHGLNKFQHKWAEVMPVSADQRQAHYTSDELRPRVVSAFGVDADDRNYFRYHSPDIMIAAPSVEAINRGEYWLVLGELHLGLNTLSQSLFINQHPEPEKLSEMIDRDLLEPRLTPVPPKFMRKAASRSQLQRPSPKDYFLELALDSPSPSPAHTILIGDLIVEDKGDGPAVRSRDGRLHFDLIQTFTEALAGLIMNGFRLRPPLEHNPRITIDRLVVCRESWAFSPADLEFACEADESYRFLSVRRWARDHHLPRFVYFKSPIEAKPCFVDLESPIYVNLFAKGIRRVLDNSRSQGLKLAQQLIVVTEMLPAPDQTWLTDAHGHRYTSELRIVALDRG